MLSALTFDEIMWPVRMGDTMPGMVAKKFDTLIITFAYLINRVLRIGDLAIEIC
jgi:hypothetical protein